MLQAGLSHSLSITVDDAKTARAVGSGGLDVFSTPAMIALMEQCARDCVAPHLAPGQGTVGTLVNIKHLSATPVGLTVTCRCELTEVDGKRLVFRLSCADPAGLIGEGTHERFIIDNERFMARALQKAAK